MPTIHGIFGLRLCECDIAIIRHRIPSLMVSPRRRRMKPAGSTMTGSPSGRRADEDRRVLLDEWLQGGS
jgi:hypothetical protein